MAILELPRTVAGDPPGPHSGGFATAERASSLTVEHLAYFIIGLLALLTRFWALGERALHHDETLHAAYSWYIYVGRGYIHDPLLHGPFLYYFGAFNYFLFNDNDFTARLGAALFSVALTLSPFLIRREIGRVAALLAAVALLISPVFLYVGRFIRHDIFSVLFEMLVFAALVRYAATRRPLWLYVGAAAFGLMVVNQETSYLFALIVGGPLLLIFLARVWWPGIPLLGTLMLALVLLIFVLPGTAKVDGAHNAIRDEQGQMQYEPGPLFGWRPLETDDNAYALRIRNRADNDSGRSFGANLMAYLGDLGRFFGHPALLLALMLGLTTVGVSGWLIWGHGTGPWAHAASDGDPITTVYSSLFGDRRLLIALLTFLGIYTIFFTALFHNLLGVITGTTGSLLYWLAQHNVERGGQPSYYYAVILFIYEPLLLLWGAIGAGLVLRAWWRWYLDGGRWTLRLGSGQAVDGEGDQLPVVLDEAEGSTLRRQAYIQRLAAAPLLPTALLWWALAAFGIYAWAGEKMPWLTIHVALPLLLLGAWGAQEVVGAWVRAQQRIALDEEPGMGRLPLIIFAGLFTAILLLGYVLMTAYVGFGTDEQILVPLWAVPLFVLLLLTLLTSAAGLRWGWRWAFGTLAICASLALAVYGVRNAYRLNYLSGDTPREMMIYTQTSPDVKRVVRRLEEASRRRGGKLDMPVIYDNETVWTWYMRDFSRAVASGPQLSGPPADDVQTVVILQENLDSYPQNREYLEGFRLQRYPLRWWFPEDDIYRLPTGWRETELEQAPLIARLFRAPFDEATIVGVWNYLLHRDTGAPLGATDFVIAVRPELADQIGVGLGGDLKPEEP